ncbi:MAG TPA: VanZ family protein [Candidatus Acidoferrum sp.]|nr:VanZ family protein [Candidatus Acidoferrum sp.]
MTSPPSRRFWSTTKLGASCLLLWLGIFAATLWPFNPFPNNQVQWLTDMNGIHIGKSGTLSSSSPFPGEPANDGRDCSVEILLRADNLADVHTFLSFYAPGDWLPFELRQYGQGLLIFRRFRDARNHVSGAEVDLEHVFHRGSATLISITSGARGTKVYVNGQLAQTAAGYHISSSNFSGELLLGTAPITYDAWSGDLRGLAFYRQELNATQVQQHFYEWSESGTLSADTAEEVLAQYFFDERSGTIVHNQVAGMPDLMIPRYFQVPHKGILLPPWREITPLWIYVDDLARNITGFVPLGMVLYLYLLRLRPARQAVVLTIVLGGLTSLAIEVLQAYIPQRVSGTTDIITNTLGTGLGVLLLQPRPIGVMLATWGLIAAPWGAKSSATERIR